MIPPFQALAFSLLLALILVMVDRPDPVRSQFFLGSLVPSLGFSFWGVDIFTDFPHSQCSVPWNKAFLLEFSSNSVLESPLPLAEFFFKPHKRPLGAAGRSPFMSVAITHFLPF